MSLEQASGMLGKLPAPLGALLEAGIRCGNPSALLESYARQQSVGRSVRQTMRSSIAYPLLILAVLVPLAMLFSLFLIPMFEDLFRGFDLELPALTEMVINLSHDIPMLIAGFVLIPIALWGVVRVFAAESLLHRLRGAIPVLGRMWTWAAQQEFAGILATLVEMRIPLNEATGYVANLLSDRSLARACQSLDERLGAGNSLSECMADSIHFDRVLTALVRWGEDHDLLPEALREANMFFADRIEQHASLVRRLAAPVTLVVVAIAVLLGVLALFLPLVKLVEGLT